MDLKIDTTHKFLVAALFQGDVNKQFEVSMEDIEALKDKRLILREGPNTVVIYLEDFK